MPFNASPKVAAARAIAAKFGKNQVVLLMVDLAAGTLETASYGETSALCRDAKRLADAAYEAVMAAYCQAKEKTS